MLPEKPFPQQMSQEPLQEEIQVPQFIAVPVLPASQPSITVPPEAPVPSSKQVSIFWEVH